MVTATAGSAIKQLRMVQATSKRERKRERRATKLTKRVHAVIDEEDELGNDYLQSLPYIRVKGGAMWVRQRSKWVRYWVQALVPVTSIATSS